jgi:hypothetical protein
MALSPLKNKQIEAFHDKGLTVKEIGRKTHCSHAEIRQLLKSKGKVPIEEKPKEKEPETADTVPDSVDAKTGVCDTVSISKDNTIEPKSQVLSPFTALTLLEELLDNWVGNEYEKEYMQAHKNAAALIFMYKGRKYSFQFKECKEAVGE